MKCQRDGKLQAIHILRIARSRPSHVIRTFSGTTNKLAAPLLRGGFEAPTNVVCAELRLTQESQQIIVQSILEHLWDGVRSARVDFQRRTGQ